MGQLLFKKVFFDAIRAGTKRTTIRRWTSARLRAGQRAFAPGLGWLAIESVEVVADLDQLGDIDARADGFDSADAMRAALRTLYPDTGDGTQDGRRWFRIAFHVEPAAPPTPKVTPKPKSPRKSKARRKPSRAASRRSPQIRSGA